MQTSIFAAIWDELEEGVALVSSSGAVSYCNKAFAEIFSATPTMIVNTQFARLLGAGNLDIAQEGLTCARADKKFSKTISAYRYEPDAVLWLRITFLPFQSERVEPGSIIVILKDITDTREAEIAHKTSEAKYTQLLSSILDSVISTNEAGIIIAANPAAQQLFGYAQAELVGQKLDMLLPVRSRAHHHDLMKGYAASNEAGRRMANFREVQGITKDGEEVFLEIAIFQNGEPGSKRLTAVIRDVTERRRMEGRLLHLQKMRAIGQLAAGIAHDFNNVMAVISGSSELGLEEASISENTRRMFGRILASARMGKDLTGKLLTFARVDVQQLQTLEVASIFSDLGEMIGRTFDANVHVETRVEPGCWDLIADPSQLQNALINLAINARDAMPHGGSIVIRAQNCPSYPLMDQAGRVRPVEMVQIDVSDTGNGMTEDVRQRALEPFFTTKGSGQGTGLGLATVFGVVQRCGGGMDIVSDVGKGTTVRLLFPRAGGSTAATRQEEQSLDTQKLLPRVVLIVEDNLPLRQTLCEQLRKLQITVYDAGNTQHARELFANHPDIEMLITDYRLTEDATGLDLARELKGQKQNLPVLIMTGYLELTAAREAPADIIIATKPVPFNDLVDHMRRAALSLKKADS